MAGYLDLVTLIVREYDRSIRFFTDVLGFELVRDEPSLTNDGRPKRWVEVRPPQGGTGLLLARADGPQQEAAVGEQMAGRVGWFLRVENFEAAYQRLVDAGVELIGERRNEAYGELVVFKDCEGNRWDLLGPSPEVQTGDDSTSSSA